MFGGVVLIVYNLFNWYSAKYMVTNMRVLGQEGLARKRGRDSLLTSISHVRTRSSLVGRLFHFGQINILSALGEAGADTFTAIKDPETFKKRILEQRMAAEAPIMPSTSPQMALYAQQSMPTNGQSADVSAVPKGAEVLTTLAVLASLRDAQTITSEEY